MQKLRIRETGASVMQRRNPVSGPESVVAIILRSGTSGHEPYLAPAVGGGSLRQRAAAQPKPIDRSCLIDTRVVHVNLSKSNNLTRHFRAKFIERLA